MNDFFSPVRMLSILQVVGALVSMILRALEKLVEERSSLTSKAFNSWDILCLKEFSIHS